MKLSVYVNFGTFSCFFVIIEGWYWRVSNVRQWSGESAGCLSTACACRLAVQLFGSARFGGGVISVDRELSSQPFFVTMNVFHFILVSLGLLCYRGM